MSNLIRATPAVRNGLSDPRSTGTAKPYRSPDVNAVQGTLKKQSVNGHGGA